jgi:hypothetical protein
MGVTVSLTEWTRLYDRYTLERTYTFSGLPPPETNVSLKIELD